ncbi:hypothetical protein G7046_g10139 [Stylonectria norvegica]|nr:hypothetical protein G7046_g10139 [Stylonectria norvegica]
MRNDERPAATPEQVILAVSIALVNILLYLHATHFGNPTPVAHLPVTARLPLPSCPSPLPQVQDDPPQIKGRANSVPSDDSSASYSQLRLLLFFSPPRAQTEQQQQKQQGYLGYKPAKEIHRRLLSALSPSCSPSAATTTDYYRYHSLCLTSAIFAPGFSTLLCKTALFLGFCGSSRSLPCAVFHPFIIHLFFSGAHCLPFGVAPKTLTADGTYRKYYSVWAPTPTDVPTLRTTPNGSTSVTSRSLHRTKRQTPAPS